MNKEWFLLHWKIEAAFLYERRSEASLCTIQTWIVRPSCVNLWTAQLLKPWVLTHLDVYTPGQACSCALCTPCLRPIRFSLHYWYLIFFSSDSFPCVIAPAFSTPAFSASPQHSCHNAIATPLHDPPPSTTFVNDILDQPVNNENVNFCDKVSPMLNTTNHDDDANNNSNINNYNTCKNGSHKN